MASTWFADLGKSELKKRFFEPQPRLRMYLNSTEIDDDTVFFIDPATTSLPLIFNLENGGKTDAVSVTLFLQIQDIFTNLVTCSGEWHYSSGMPGKHLAHYAFQNNARIVPKSGWSLPDFRIDVSSCQIFGIVGRATAAGIVGDRYKVHFWKTNAPASILKGKDARQLIHEIAGTNYNSEGFYYLYNPKALRPP